MLQLLGINGLTYVLALFIVLLSGTNALLGPGWLGNAIGIPGTGQFVQNSDSVPEAIDLGSADFRIR